MGTELTVERYVKNNSAYLIVRITRGNLSWVNMLSILAINQCGLWAWLEYEIRRSWEPLTEHLYHEN